MTDQRTIKLALSCYPHWWRDRYGEEVRAHSLDMIADGRSSAALSFSLLWGAATARWSARGMPRDYRLWSMRTRVSIAWATLTWLLIAPIARGVTGNEKIGVAFAPIRGLYQRPNSLPMAPAARIVTDSESAMATLSLVTVLLLVAGWIRLIGGIRRSSAPNRSRMLMLAWVPGISGLVLLVGVIVDVALVRPSSIVGSGRSQHITDLNGYPSAAHILGVVLGDLGIVAWLASIVCVAIAAKRVEVRPSELRYGTGLSIAVAVLFGLLLASYIVWGVALTLEAHQAAHGGFNTITYARQDLWVPMAVLLSIGAGVSIASARTAWRSWSVLGCRLS